VQHWGTNTTAKAGARRAGGEGATRGLGQDFGDPGDGAHVADHARKALDARQHHSSSNSHELSTRSSQAKWPKFKALRQHYAGARFEEQHQLYLPQKHKAKVPKSTLRIEINGLEEQADNAKARDLYWKPL